MTPLQKYQSDHQRCLQLAGELLGGPARAADLQWELERQVRRCARRELRRGIATEHALLEFDSGAVGHELAIGLERLRLDLPDGPLRVVKVTLPCRQGAWNWYDFWAVRVEDYRRFYRFLRSRVRAMQRHRPPILREGDLERLWDNTIGFLRQGVSLLERFAELDELKKLLVLRYAETARWQWEWAWAAFASGRGDACRRPKIGFNAPMLMSPPADYPSAL